MTRASKLFSEADKQAVEHAVAQAEQGTSGEIVPVVATRSGRYDRAEDVFGVLLGLVAVAAVWVCFQRVDPRGGDWGEGYALGVRLWAILVTYAAGFVVGVVLSTYIPALARPFVGRREIDDEVQRRAQQAFFQFRVRATGGGTGILIYISLFERRVVVLGDTPISDKLDQPHWDELKTLVVDGLRTGKPTEGICAAIGRCGQLLAQHFPVAPGDVNEISNELRLID